MSNRIAGMRRLSITWSRWAAASVLCGLAPLLAPLGCAKPPATPESATSTFERGPLKLTIRATPKAIWMGDVVRVTLEVAAPADCLIEFPQASAFGAGVEVLKQESAAPTPIDGANLWRHVADVEPLTTGVVEIPPLVVKYARQPGAALPSASQMAASGPAFENELLGESLQLEVRSALTSQDSLTSPRDITAALLAPARPLKPWEWALLGAGAVAALLGGWALFRWMRRRRSRPAPPIAPEVWALRELADLDAAAWLGRGAARGFYFRLTEVARAYIERKFHIAAPEMTTEEFLSLLARDRSALPYDAGKLRLFLNSCDMVKYAALEPRVEDATQALESARSFIHATAAASDFHRDAGAHGSAGAAA